MGKYELIVRKKVSAFIEKQFRYFGYDFDHDEYKKVTYGEKGISTPLEEKLKSYFDAYMYLLSNAKSPLTKAILNKFNYILFEDSFNEISTLSLETKLLEICELSPIEKACEFHMYVYEKLSYLDECDRQIVSLMFFNYILVKNDIPCVKLIARDISKYVNARDKYYEQKEILYMYFTELVKNSLVLKKTYLKNLKETSVSDIYRIINELKDELQNKYHVENIYLYGSYAKGINRIDSDIDLLVRLSFDLLYGERKQIIDNLKEYLFNKFNRFVDIEEVREFFSDEFVKEARTLKKII